MTMIMCVLCYPLISHHKIVVLYMCIICKCTNKAMPEDDMHFLYLYTNFDHNAIHCKVMQPRVQNHTYTTNDILHILCPHLVLTLLSIS